MTITPELKHALASANGSPLRLEDPETDEVYLVTKETREEDAPDIAHRASEGMRLAYAAFLEDLPRMLADPKFKGKIALYRRGELIAIGKDRFKLYLLAARRGIPEDDFAAFAVEPQETDFESVSSEFDDMTPHP